MTALTATGNFIKPQARSLSDTEYHYQAEQFLSWFRRLPSSVTVTSAFQEWAGSKSFAPVQRDHIWVYVLDLLDASIDGPFDTRVSLALDSVISEED